MEVTSGDKAGYATIVGTWKAFVRATHTFLPEDEIQ
jgi:hypothetical protein